MHTTRRSPRTSLSRGRVAAVTAMLLLPVVPVVCGGALSAASADSIHAATTQAGPIAAATTPAEPGASPARPTAASTTPTTGTAATDAAVSAGLLLAVGGFSVFAARSMRRRPSR